jgi:hypothetical protein
VQFRYGFWNATSDEEKLEFIYLHSAGWMLSGSRLRLMHWPGEPVMTPREGNQIDHFRLPYPPSEVESNSVNWAEAVANQGGDATG